MGGNWGKWLTQNPQIYTTLVLQCFLFLVLLCFLFLFLQCSLFLVLQCFLFLVLQCFLCSSSCSAFCSSSCSALCSSSCSASLAGCVRPRLKTAGNIAVFLLLQRFKGPRSQVIYAFTMREPSKPNGHFYAPVSIDRGHFVIYLSVQNLKLCTSYGTKLILV